MERMFRMCPFCHGTLRLIRSGGAYGFTFYHQCLECRQITTDKREISDKPSYFEWLMSRPTTKRAMVALKAQSAIGPTPAGASST
jgi:hypothetical protein